MNFIKTISNAFRGDTSAAPVAPPVQAFNARRSAPGPDAAPPADSIGQPPASAAPIVPPASIAPVDSSPQDITTPPVTTEPAEKTEQPLEARSVDDLSPEIHAEEINRRFNFIEERKKIEEKIKALARDEADARHRGHMKMLEEQARLEREEAERVIEATRAKKAATKNNPHRTWDNKFAKNLYGIDFEDHNGFLPKPILAVVMERGDLRDSIEKIKQQLEPFFVRFEEAEKHMRELNLQIPEQMVRDAMRKDASLAADGKFAELLSSVEHPNPDEIHRMLDFRRTLLREAQRLAAESCRPLILEIGERLQSAARLLADELDESERATAEKFGVMFVPSPQLRACIGAGFFYAEQVRLTFIPAARVNPRQYIQSNLLGK